MKLNHVAAALTAALVCLPAYAQVFVDDNFNSYADQAALETAWGPDAGDGVSPGGSNGVLIPTTNTNFPPPTDNPPDLDGGAIGNFGAGGVNESTASFEVEPSATQNVVVRGDIFVDTDASNWRQTIGLRNDTIDRDPGTFGDQLGLNILEMGFWNADTCDTTVQGCADAVIAGDPITDQTPGYIAETQFGYRVTLFGFGTLGNLIENGVDQGQLIIAPNYRFFPLDPALDLPENGGNNDGVVDTADILSGFHRYEATISETGITMTLDLFANGLNEISGASGVDSTVEIGIGLAVDPANTSDVAGFTSLRVGGPSGVTGNTPAVFDNLYLALEDAAADIPGDFDGDGDVDVDDFGVFVNSFQLSPQGGPPFADGDFDEDGDVDVDDFGVFVNSFQMFPPPALAVPEPGAACLVALAAFALAGDRRRG